MLDGHFYEKGIRCRHCSKGRKVQVKLNCARLLSITKLSSSSREIYNDKNTSKKRKNQQLCSKSSNNNIVFFGISFLHSFLASLFHSSSLSFIQFEFSFKYSDKILLLSNHILLNLKFTRKKFSTTTILNKCL